MRMESTGGFGVLIEQLADSDDHVYIGHYRAGFGVSKADLAAALNAIEGFEVTYTPPRKNPGEVVRDLPNGSYFGWSDNPGKIQYFKDSNGKIRNFAAGAGVIMPYAFDWAKDADSYIVIYGGEVD